MTANGDTVLTRRPGSPTHNYILPDELKVASVIFFCRHGERMPGVLATEAPEFGISWTSQQIRDQFKSVKDHTVHLHDESLPLNEVAIGQLTDEGRRTTFATGRALRELYIQKHGLLDREASKISSQDVEYKSTAMTRTQETLQQLVRGFLDNDKEASQAKLHTIHGRYSYTESRSVSPALLDLDSKSIQRSQQKWDSSDELNLVNQRLRSIAGNVTVETINSHYVMDAAICATFHGLSVPKELQDPKVLNILESIAVDEWFGGYDDLRLAKLAMGRIIAEVSERFNRSSKQPKVTLVACHDVTLGGLLSALQCYDGRWPPFTSHLTFELLQDKKSGHERYCRIRYNGETIQLLSTYPQARNDKPEWKGIYTLETFERALARVKMSDSEWEAASYAVSKL